MQNTQESESNRGYGGAQDPMNRERVAPDCVVGASRTRDNSMRAVALLGIVLTSTALHAQGPAIVSGVVRDENGSPIREALVVIDPDSLSLRARTGVDGRYRITAVPNGRYEVRAVRIGFSPVTRTIDVTGREVELDLEMRAVPIPLDTVAVRVSRPGLYGLVVTRGIALLPHEPRPLRGALIEVINSPHQTRSGADGRFSIPQLAIGSHAIMVTRDHYAPRMVPVTVPPEGGVDITFTLDSMYAEYQFKDADRVRDISRRVRRATSPFTFVPAHEIDPEAPNLRDALRYANSVLSRGVILQNAPACIFVDGIIRPDLRLHDIPPIDIEGIEIYPPGTLQVEYGVVRGNVATPCGGVEEGSLFSSGTRGPGSFSKRTLVRTRGNGSLLVMIWTTKRR